MTTPAPVDDVDRIAAAVLACPAVARLHPGPFGTLATYLPGRRVPGVRLHDGPADPLVEVGITARFGTPLAGAAEQVRAAVAAVSPAREATVAVLIGDVAA